MYKLYIFININFIYIYIFYKFDMHISYHILHKKT